MTSVELTNNSESFSNFENLLKLFKDNIFNKQVTDNLINDFIKKSMSNFPLIKKNEVYFIFKGKGKLVHVVGDFNGWDSFDNNSKMMKLGNSDLFYLKKSFPDDSRLDYQFVVDTEWVLDPYNENKILGGFGFNSELKMPKHNELLISIDRNENVNEGTIKELYFHSEIQKHWNRKIYIYLPPGYRLDNDKKYPSVYAIDGTDYLTAGNAKSILDNLIISQKIPESIFIFIDPITQDLRIRDFSGKDCSDQSEVFDSEFKCEICRDNYCEFLTNELIPYVDSNYKTIANDPSKRAHIGVSLGGILSTYIGSKYPNLFRLIGSQSGAFWIDKAVYKKFRKIAPIKEMKFYLNAGIFEKRNFDCTKEFASILKAKNYLLKEEYFSQGHSWGLWKETFGPMLEYLLNS